jgi:Fe-Mn family superoxide dismutase
MAHDTPPLPYPYSALEPHIDEQTMQIHHDKHHAAYVGKLNDAIKGTEFEGQPVEQVLRDINKVPEKIRGAVRNHGGGHANHSLFWQVIGPKGGGEPAGDLGTAIKAKFDTFQGFKDRFSEAGATRFGSGWSWLVVKGNGSLDVYSTANQDSPLMEGDTPILGMDVWEHAYYLKYQNRRPDYIAAFFNVINWTKVAEKFAAAKK